MFDESVERRFTDGSDLNSDIGSSTDWELGVFTSENLMASLLYSDADGASYGVGLDGLVRLESSGSFVELSGYYLDTDYEREEIAVVNSTVRNLNTESASGEMELGVGATFFPTVKTSLGVSYATAKEEDGREQRTTLRSVNAGWFFLENAGAQLSYALIDAGSIEESIWSVEGSYRF